MLMESGASTVIFQCNRKVVNSVLSIQEGNYKSCVLPLKILSYNKFLLSEKNLVVLTKLCFLLTISQAHKILDE